MEELWIDYINISDLKAWEKNPKLHASEAIGASIDRHGFVEPIIIDEETVCIASGHGRIEELCRKYNAGEKPPTNIKLGESGVWQAPVIRGNHFKDEAELSAYVVTANRLTELGGWNESLLDKIIAEVAPVGFDALKELEKDVGVVEITHKDPVTGIIPDEVSGFKGVSPTTMTTEGLKHTAELDSKLDWDNIPGHLQGVWGLDDEKVFSTENKLGIPELLPEMILGEFPKPLLTWGGPEDTPDDGNSYYLYSFGSTSNQGIPFKRALLCYFTGDKHIETLWNTTAYQVGKMMTTQVIGCVVPDFSYWEGNPRVLHMYAAYRAHWLGRFMQEAGVKVVPRFEYYLEEVRDFSLIGVPKGTPTLATQLHTAIDDMSIERIKYSLISGLDLIRPGQLLVYSSEKGREILDEIKGDLACDELIVLPTAKEVRRPKESWKEEDPYLLELRNRKHGREGRKTTGG